MMRILAIDDNLDNLTVLKAVVSDHLPGTEVLIASNGPAGLELARSRDPDVILLDIVMPGMDGYAVCRTLKQDALLQVIPVLFLTALRTDRDSRVRALEAGAEGFLSKPVDEVELVAQIRAMAKIKAAASRQRTENERLAALVEERTRGLEESRTAALELLGELKAENEARKASDAALRESEERFRSLFEHAPLGYQALDADGRFIEVNEAWLEALGYAREEVVGKWFGDFLAPESVQGFRERFPTFKANGKVHSEFYMLDKSGERRYMAFDGRIGHHPDGSFKQTHCILADHTERKRAEEEKARLEAQLQQAIKMESVGRLAGGVAHDFNNMLGVILGHAELAIEELDPSQPIFASLVEIRQAAEHSADLTRQLLAFARKQTASPKVLDLNEVVAGTLKMLGRLIGEDIELVWCPGAGLWPTKIDPSQVDQILTNLCVNARDAIAGVGQVTIRTDSIVFTEADCAGKVERVPGEFCLLAVSDTGCGMDASTIAHVFEPFFTTKEVGKGTGLGLATVYGIVKQNGGFIDLVSEPGLGTTFRIYLPRHLGDDGGGQGGGEDRPCLRGDETILLVEDEPSLLRMATKMLGNQGYTVLAAGTPGEAMRLASAHGHDIRLLITDVVMPKMNGLDLARELRTCHPHLKCLFMSGYAASAGTLNEGDCFIQKPFTIRGLAAKVRDTLKHD